MSAQLHPVKYMSVQGSARGASQCGAKSPAFSVRARLGICFMVVCAALSVGTASRAAMQTGSPRWSISSDAEPTNFSASETQDAVQVYSVSATGGNYRLSVHGGESAAELSTPIEWDELANGLQAKLEAVADLGAGNVEVSGGPGGTSPYSIKYIGSLSGHGNHLLLRDSLLTGGEETIVQGGAGEVSAAAHDRFTLTATNVGSRASEGVVSIMDKLPPSLVAVGAEIEERPSTSSEKEECSVKITVECEYSRPVPPGGKLVVIMYIALSSSSMGSLVNEAKVSGGEGGEVSTSESTPANVGPALFGIDQFAFEAVGLGGQPDLQAGDHPYSVTTDISFNTVFAGVGGRQLDNVPAEVKDVSVELPMGFVGDAFATPRCPEVDMLEQIGKGGSGRTPCPANSIVGTIWLTMQGNPWEFGPYPIYNIVPEQGYPAELGFNAADFGQPIFLFASVIHSKSGYRVRITAPGSLRVLHSDIERIALTVFGDPSQQDGGTGSAAFVTNPTACSNEPVTAKAEATAWESSPDAPPATAESTTYPVVTGCDLLQGASGFNPAITVRSEEKQVDTPSGYEVELNVPQAPNVFGQLATPELKDASVTFPAGVSLSPSAASGSTALEGCKSTGPEGINIGSQEIGSGGKDLGDPEATELGAGHTGPSGNGSPYDDGLWHITPGHCPAKSQVGDVELKTPLLEAPLYGHVYVAAPRCGGAAQPICTPASSSDGDLFGIYIELSGSGVIIKLHGKVSVNPQTGQITTSFTENPQLPFDSLKLRLYNGPRAPLANPQTCGLARPTSELVPWSTPSTPTATPISPSLDVTGCVNPMPFAPGFTAGTGQTIAGGFTTFAMILTRNDGEQDFAGVLVAMPPGVSGMISNVPPCGEPQASQGMCPETSRIGTANVAAGAGSHPLGLAGPVYLTGPYKGAPFGLSIVVPAKAGPFNLGNEVVRAAISVDPLTARVTVASDPIPQVKDGVPFRLKAINVTVDRPGFIFNPTNCNQLHVNGTIAADMPDGSPGLTVAVSSPFAVAGCKNLPFHPVFSVLTKAHHSRANGASLHVVVRSGAGQANISSVFVELPKVLPSRLSTLNQACLQRVFLTNPAACPAGSRVGGATVSTPVLPVQLKGPAYFVSNGGGKFPELVIVLQGDGVTFEMHGETLISKGITSSKFASVPDVPFTRFDLTLPTGSHSALAGTADFCKAKLVMPTTIRGQNNAMVNQKTKIAVDGCPKPKKKAKKR